MSQAPFSAAWRGMSSSRVACRAPITAEVAIGLPPNVVVWMYGFSMRGSKTSGVDVKQPTGITAPPSALPMVMMSGATPQCSIPHSVPVRPMPVCTSSAMNRTPHLSQISRTLGKKSSGGTRAPASPWTGSAMNAAMSSPMASQTLSSFSSASASP